MGSIGAEGGHEHRRLEQELQSFESESMSCTAGRLEDGEGTSVAKGSG